MAGPSGKPFRVTTSKVETPSLSGFDVQRSFPDLRIIFVAGSQLGADLARRSLESFGPVVYNMYGSTEVAYATVATPQDLAVEPGCVGSPATGRNRRGAWH